MTFAYFYALFRFIHNYFIAIDMGEKVGVVPVPAGETLNFDYSNPWEYKENIIIVSVGLTLSTLFLAMRIYTRVCLLSKFGWDDGVSMSLNQ